MDPICGAYISVRHAHNNHCLISINCSTYRAIGPRCGQGNKVLVKTYEVHHNTNREVIMHWLSVVELVIMGQQILYLQGHSPQFWP